MLPRILIAEPLDFSPEAVRLLETSAEVTLRATDRAGLAAAFRDFDVVWFRLGHRVDRELLAGPLRCRILATPVTGLDHIDLAACGERGIRVVSLRGETRFLEQVRGTAELTLALTLALLRRIHAAAADVERGGWNRDSFRGRELFSRTVGLVGVGRLGRIVASYFRAFGMDVAGYDPRPDFPYDAARRVESLVDLLAQSDVVSMHVSYDASTRHLIGRKELAAIKPGAVLVNTSRGGLVDESALLESLQSGTLAGAALDVLDGEPRITTEHPLVAYARSCDRLLIVPHIGGNTVESFEKTEYYLAGRVIETLASLALVDCSSAGSIE
ncbi:MAG: hydroxyacid dehydrogenase [Planctomycetia bacterium]|nr:hydroxyacid dehydrogenase [Planctomycetia bacterium]